MKGFIIKVASSVMLIVFLTLMGCADQDHMTHKRMEKNSMSGEMNKEMVKDEMQPTTEMKTEMMSEASDTIEKERDESMSNNMNLMEE